MTEWQPPEWDDMLREPLLGDDDPSGITRIQAEKCAAIIQAYALGHHGWASHLPLVGRFMSAVCAANMPGVVCRPSAAELWSELDALPWPLPGGPRPQDLD